MVDENVKGDDTAGSDTDANAQAQGNENNGSADASTDAKDAGKDAGTAFADDGGGDDAGQEKRGAFGDDWRETLAGKDDKLLARLKRFSSPSNIIKSWQEAEKKLTSGQLKKVLADDATPEEISAWKKENGLPEKAEDYSFDDLGDGYVLSEDDKPMVNEFRQLAFAKNINPADARDLVKWWKQQEDAQVVALADADKHQKMAAIEDMRNEYGGEYKGNLGAGKNLLVALFGADNVDSILAARLPDNRQIGNSPDLMKPLIQFARENLAGSDIMPGGTGDVGKAVKTEIQEIEHVMNTDYDKYMRDANMQARYLDLLSARERMGSGAA